MSCHRESNEIVSRPPDHASPPDIDELMPVPLKYGRPRGSYARLNVHIAITAASMIQY